LAAFFRGKKVFFKLGQLAGAAQGVGVDDVGHVALGVAVLLGLHVQHELRQGAVQPGNGACHDAKARARELDAHLKVQAQGLAQVHMVAGLKGQRAAPARLPQTVPSNAPRRCRLLPRPRARSRGANWARPAAGLGARVEFAPSAARAFKFGLGGRDLGHHGAGVFAFGLELANLFGELVALVLQFLGAHLQGLAFGFQGLESVNVQGKLGEFALFKTGQDRGQVFAKQLYIEHGGILVEPFCGPDTCRRLPTP
jgi:hypothetical protein